MANFQTAGYKMLLMLHASFSLGVCHIQTYPHTKVKQMYRENTENGE